MDKYESIKNDPNSFWRSKSLTLDIELKRKLKKLGLELDLATGHLYYDKAFKPLTLTYELVFVRHGETYGNCGQSADNGQIDDKLVKADIKNKEYRIYQGDVDTEINQLTELGKQQAIHAAEKLDSTLLQQGWCPDVILVSPLTRAKDTAMPFIIRNNFQDRLKVHTGIREMAFGDWDNRRVCDFDSNHPCHLFYRNQHALIKNASDGTTTLQAKAENFCEVLIRAYTVLRDLETEFFGKRLLMFSHSMFGAACCILLGRGQKIEGGEYLAFDGKKTDGTYYTMPNAEPFILNFELPSFKKNSNFLK